MIEEVERFRAKDQVQCIMESSASLNTQVQIPESWPVNEIPTQRSLPQRRT